MSRGRTSRLLASIKDELPDDTNVIPHTHLSVTFPTHKACPLHHRLLHLRLTPLHIRSASSSQRLLLVLLASPLGFLGLPLKKADEG